MGTEGARKMAAVTDMGAVCPPDRIARDPATVAISFLITPMPAWGSTRRT